jgi:hypothetical protein
MVHGILDRIDALGIELRDLDTKGSFKGHDELDLFQSIDMQIPREGRAGAGSSSIETIQICRDDLYNTRL